MGAHKVTLVPGDCPEQFEDIQPVLDALGVEIRWDAPGDHPTLDGLVHSAQATGTVLMGYAHGQRDNGELAPVVQLRKALQCFCNLRPIRNLEGMHSVHEGVDLVVVRETTEDIYAHLEHESIPGVFESLKVTTRAACERIARYGYEFARARGRKKVTIVHKANIMKLSDGMFLRTAREVAAEYPDIETEDVIVDALCMRLILHPERFDVLLTGNLFGDIVADLCTGLVGGESNAPSINIGPDTTLFTAGHGVDADTARDNPLTVLLPLAAMLEHLGETDAATRLRTGLEAALTEERPRGLGGLLPGPAFCARVAESV